jgi:hypothetical protein
MGSFYNFTSVERIRIGQKSARIMEVTPTTLRYLNEDGIAAAVDLDDCARIQASLEHAGLFPPRDDTDWTAIATADRAFSQRNVLNGCVGLRAAVDEPPWFQFLDRRRTQFEFKDYDSIKGDLLRPLAAAGWGTWDAS